MSRPADGVTEIMVNAETKITVYPGPTTLYCVSKRRTMVLIPFWFCLGCYTSMEEARSQV